MATDYYEQAKAVAESGKLSGYAPKPSTPAPAATKSAGTTKSTKSSKKSSKKKKKAEATPDYFQNAFNVVSNDKRMSGSGQAYIDALDDAAYGGRGSTAAKTANSYQQALDAAVSSTAPAETKAETPAAPVQQTPTPTPAPKQSGLQAAEGLETDRPMTQAATAQLKSGSGPAGFKPAVTNLGEQKPFYQTVLDMLAQPKKNEAITTMSFDEMAAAANAQNPNVSTPKERETFKNSDEYKEAAANYYKEMGMFGTLRDKLLDENAGWNMAMKPAEQKYKERRKGELTAQVEQELTDQANAEYDQIIAANTNDQVLAAAASASFDEQAANFDLSGVSAEELQEMRADYIREYSENIKKAYEEQRGAVVDDMLKNNGDYIAAKVADNLDDTNWGKLWWGLLEQGAGQTVSGVSNTLDMLTGWAAQPIHEGLQKLVGENIDLGEKNIISRWNDYVNDTYAAEQEMFANNAANDKTASVVNKYGATVAGAIPMALVAIMTAGTSAAGMATTEGLQAYSYMMSQGTGLAQWATTISTGMQTMMKDPNFSVSMVTETGSAYHEAIESGANDAEAAVYAATYGWWAALVEVGGVSEAGGLQSLPQHFTELLEKEAANLTPREAAKKAALEYAKSIVSEAGEENIQGMLEVGLSFMYGNQVDIMKSGEADALIDPTRIAEEAIGAAVTSVFLGAGQMGAVKAMNAIANAAARGATEYHGIPMDGIYVETEDGTVVDMQTFLENRGEGGKQPAKILYADDESGELVDVNDITEAEQNAPEAEQNGIEAEQELEIPQSLEEAQQRMNAPAEQNEGQLKLPTAEESSERSNNPANAAERTAQINEDSIIPQSLEEAEQRMKTAAPAAENVNAGADNVNANIDNDSRAANNVDYTAKDLNLLKAIASGAVKEFGGMTKEGAQAELERRRAEGAVNGRNDNAAANADTGTAEPAAADNRTADNAAGSTDAGAAAAAADAEYARAAADRADANRTAGADTAAVVHDGGRERGDGISAQRPAGSMGGQPQRRGRTGQGRAGGEQTQRSLARQTAVNERGVKYTSAAELGIQNGTDSQITRVIPEDLWDDELKECDSKIFERTGKHCTFVLGQIEVDTGDGRVHRARAVVKNDGIIVQADNLQQTAIQLADHESMHDMVSHNPGLLDAEINSILDNIAPQQLQNMMNAYAERYGSFLKGLSEEEAARYVLEEIAADAYAGINAYGMRAGDMLQDAVMQTLEDRKVIPPSQRQGEGAKATRGPPEQRLSAAEMKDVKSSQPVSTDVEVRYSLQEDSSLMDKTKDWLYNNVWNKRYSAATPTDYTYAEVTRLKIAKYMRENYDALGIPGDTKGNTLFGNQSYGRSLENTTVCIRSLLQDSFAKAVEQKLGRKLSINESIYLALEMRNFTDEPQCAYCYVAADRMAFDDALGKFLNERDIVFQAFDDGLTAEQAAKKLAGKRKLTDNIKERTDYWYNMREKGITQGMLTQADLAGVTFSDESIEEGRAKLDSDGARYEYDMAIAYARSASHAKKRVNYTAYDGNLLDETVLPEELVKTLNEEFGLRMYSYSDYSPAFILENMQMITDAAARGLKMLAYTKELDFVRIFAQTGMNINISVFAYEDADGNIAMDGMQGADWAEAKALRDQYPNVGITFVATSDNIVERLMANENNEFGWVDVILPYHSVFTGGTKIGRALGYTDYKSVQGDKKTRARTQAEKQIAALKKEGKEIGQDLLDLAINPKEVYPTVHDNDLIKYVNALQESGLTPRFAKWLNGYSEFKAGHISEQQFREMNPSYMKLVNETRRSASQTPPVKPIFDENEAMKSLQQMKAEGGYNALGRRVDLIDDIAEEYADKINAGEAKAINTEKPTKKPKQVQKFSMSEPLEETDKMIAAHNFDSAVLQSILDLGAMPGISVAVTLADSPGGLAFGDVTALFNRDTVDPEADPRNKLFGADAWTPTRRHVYKRTISGETFERVNTAVQSMMFRNRNMDEVIPDVMADPLVPFSGSNTEEIIQDFMKDPLAAAAYLRNRNQLGNLEKFRYKYSLPMKDLREIYRAMKGGADSISQATVRNAYVEVMTAKELSDRGGMLEKMKAKRRARNQYDNMSEAEIANLVDELTQLAVDGEESFDDSSLYDVMLMQHDIVSRAEMDDKYYAWAKMLILHSGVKPSLTDKAGNVLEETAENIAKALRTVGERGVHADALRPNGLQAFTTAKYNSIEEARSDLDRQRGYSWEKYRNESNKVEREIAALARAIVDDVGIEDSDVSEAYIQYAAKAFDITADYDDNFVAISSTSSKLSPETVDLMIDTFTNAGNMPTDYFEAKAFRAVGFNEIAALVVPNSMNSDLLQQLHDRGIRTISYEANNNADRVEKIRSVSEVRFSMDEADAEYMAAVESDDVRKQMDLVKRAAEQAGFTEELYHGTSAFGFTQISLDKARYKTAFFLSSSPDVAEGYFGYRDSDYGNENGYLKAIGKKSDGKQKLGATTPVSEILTKLNEYTRDYENDTAITATTRQQHVEKTAGNIIEQAKELLDYAMQDEAYYPVYEISNAATPEEIISAAHKLEGVYEITYNGFRANMPSMIYEKLKDNLKLLEGLNDKEGVIHKRRWSNSEYFIPAEELADIYNDFIESEKYGVYQFYANPGKQLAVYCDGSQWDSVPVPEEAKADFDGDTTNTNDLAAWAKANGYDSVLFQDVYDIGNYGNAFDLSDVQAYFYPQRDVKSADAITYDDNDNVIPLSERFNPRNQDIRFSIADDQAMDEETMVDRINYYARRAQSGTYTAPDIDEIRDWVYDDSRMYNGGDSFGGDALDGIKELQQLRAEYDPTEDMFAAEAWDEINRMIYNLMAKMDPDKQAVIAGGYFDEEGDPEFTEWLRENGLRAKRGSVPHYYSTPWTEDGQTYYFDHTTDKTVDEATFQRETYDDGIDRYSMDEGLQLPNAEEPAQQRPQGRLTLGGLQKNADAAEKKAQRLREDADKWRAERQAAKSRYFTKTSLNKLTKEVLEGTPFVANSGKGSPRTQTAITEILENFAEWERTMQSRSQEEYSRAGQEQYNRAAEIADAILDNTWSETEDEKGAMIRENLHNVTLKIPEENWHDLGASYEDIRSNYPGIRLSKTKGAPIDQWYHDNIEGRMGFEALGSPQEILDAIQEARTARTSYSEYWDAGREERDGIREDLIDSIMDKVITLAMTRKGEVAKIKETDKRSETELRAALREAEARNLKLQEILDADSAAMDAARELRSRQQEEIDGARLKYGDLLEQEAARRVAAEKKLQEAERGRRKKKDGGLELPNAEKQQLGWGMATEGMKRYVRTMLGRVNAEAPTLSDAEHIKNALEDAGMPMPAGVEMHFATPDSEALVVSDPRYGKNIPVMEYIDMRAAKENTAFDEHVAEMTRQREERAANAQPNIMREQNVLPKIQRPTSKEEAWYNALKEVQDPTPADERPQPMQLPNAEDDGEDSELLNEQTLSRNSFRGTSPLQKLGIKVAGSVGRYAHIDRMMAANKAAKSVMKEARKAEKRLRATAGEMEFARGVASMMFSIDDVPKSMRAVVVEELADYYSAEKSVNADAIHEQRKDIKRTLDQNMDDLFRNVDVKKKTGMFSLHANTPARNMRKLFGNDAGQDIYEKIFRPVSDNEAERFRFVNRMYNEVREFTDSKGKKRQLNKSERALVQQVIEGRAAAAMVAAEEMQEAITGAVNESIRKGTALADLAEAFQLHREELELAARYKKWLQIQDDLKNSDETIINAAADKYTEMFDDFYAATNDFLVAHGYDPIGFIKGYAPHLQPEANTNALNSALQRLGLLTEGVTELPTEIAGLTASYKPMKKWNPFFLERHGDNAKLDIVEGYESYVDYMSNVLYHTDDIMRVRAMSNYFRRAFSDDNISEEISHALGLRNLKPEEKITALRLAKEIKGTSFISPEMADEMLEEYIDKLLGKIEKTKDHNELVVWADNYANILAGKQSIADRGAEMTFGRKSLSWANKLTSWFAGAQVGGKISSALNQGAQLPIIYAELGAKNFARACKDATFGRIRRADWAQESDFLTGKAGINYIATDVKDMLMEKLFLPAEIMDGTVSTIAVRGAYLKAIDRGMSHEEAMRYADKFGEEVMGSRMRGSKPTLFEAKNPVIRMMTVFQVEALNTWEHIKKDLPRDFQEIEKKHGKKAAATALAGVIIKAIFATFALNRLDDELYGGSPAPYDVIGLTANFIASGNSLTTNQLMQVFVNDCMEKLGQEGIFDVDDSTMSDGEFDLASAVEDTGYNVMNDIPLARNVMNLLGLGDSSLPLAGLGHVPAIYKAGKNMLDGVDDGEVKELISALKDAALEFVPAGGQANKTYKGAKIIAEGGKRNSKGQMQYTYDFTPAKIAQLLLFGPSGTQESAEYYANGGKGKTLTQNQQTIYDAVTSAGSLSPKETYDMIKNVYKEMNDLKTTSGAKSITKEVAKEALDKTKALDGVKDANTVKAIIWQSVNKGWDDKSNPYSTAVGWKIKQVQEGESEVIDLFLPEN